MLVSVDLDATYLYGSAYTRRSGVPDVDDPVFTTALPRLLDLLDTLGIRATLFVVGQDLKRPRQRDAVLSALGRGHEVANHTQTHPLGLAKATGDTVEREIREAHESIEARLGVSPRGFRAPGWDVCPSILGGLHSLDYTYDSSVAPSWFGAVQGGVLKLLSGFRAPGGYGTWRVAFAPPRPYYPELDRPWRRGTQHSLLEIPAGMTPRWRIPYCATVQLAFGHRGLQRSAQATGPDPLVYVMHALDFLGADEVDDAARRHPTLKVPLESRLRKLREILGAISVGRTSRTMLDHALPASAQHVTDA